MPLPTLDKTWQHDTNNFFAADATPAGNTFVSRQQIIYQVISSLLGFAANAWVHVASSDGTTASSVSNQITSSADIVWGTGGGSSRSWIVLRQAGLSSDFEVLFDFQETFDENGAMMHVTVAPDGFDLTGISVSNPPSASDGSHGVHTFETQYGGGDNNATILDTVVNAHMSNDGEVTRVFVRRNGVHAASWRFEKLKDPEPSMTMPVIWNRSFAQTNNPGFFEASIFRYYENTIFSFMQLIDGVSFTSVEGYQTCDQVTSASLSEHMPSTNAFSGEEELYDAGFATFDNATEGAMGDLFDVWWTPVPGGSGNDADLYPSDGSRQFMRFTDMAFPWDGSVPTLA